MLDFDSAWPLLEEAAVLGEGIEKEEVREALREGSATFFSHGTSAAVAFDFWPVLRIGLAGGDLCELIQVEAEIWCYAKAHGYEFLDILGRPGWERALDGYEKKAVLLRKEI